MADILFIMKYPIILNETLKRKFDGQMSACVQLGHNVWYFEWDGKSINLVCKNNNSKTYILKTLLFLSKSKYYKSILFIDLYRASIIALNNYRFDFVYFREMPIISPANQIARIIMSKHIFLIYEIPTYLGDEKYISTYKNKEESLYRRFVFMISNLNLRKFIHSIGLVVAIGHKTNGVVFKRPALNISNGIDVSKLELRTIKINESEIHMLLLASMCYWHGYERVIKSLASYHGKEKIYLHFVGDDGDGSLSKWKFMVKELNLDKSTIFHGPVFGDELTDLINHMDIGIGSLGLYKENLYSASTMKAKEYMARGLPFVYAGEDPSIDELLPYVLEVRNDDSDIDMNHLVYFAQKVRLIDELPIKMRQYALNSMTWESQFNMIFEFINKNIS